MADGEVQVKRVTRGVLLGFKKQRNRLEKLIGRDPKKRMLLHRLRKIGRCNYCLRPLQSGEQFVRVGKNSYHVQCYDIVFHDVQDNFSEEELRFINGTIPIHVRGEIE